MTTFHLISMILTSFFNRDNFDDFDIQNVDNFSKGLKPKNDHLKKSSQKIQLFRQKIVSKVGLPMFSKIYEFVSQNKKTGLSNKNVFLKASKKCTGKFWKQEYWDCV